MNPQDQPNQSPQRRLIFDYFVRILSSLAIALAIFVLILNWKTLSECFKRQSLVILGVLIFSRIKLSFNIRSMFEVFPLLLVFVLVEKINVSVGGTCLVPDTLYKKTVYILYYLMFGFYLGMTIAFTLLVFCIIVYRFYDHYVLRPRRRLELGIQGKEFDELDTIKFSPENESPTTRSLSCSICLAEYQEGDLVMRLPICNHHFHKECIRKWLEDHLDCPYCRADIRTNLKVLKSMRENNGRFIMQNPIQLEPPSRGRLHLVDDESRDSYVEMR